MIKRILLLSFMYAFSFNIWASSPDDWAAFAAEVKAACSAEVGKSFENHSIYVDPFGSESYGLAIVTGKAKGGDEKTILSTICVFDKRTQKVEVGGEFSDADFTAIKEVKATHDVSAKDAIDKETDACMDKNPSTIGMQECNEKAYQRWDTELNTVYQALQKAQSSAEAKAALKTSQQNWLKFRDSELTFINKMYQNQQGTYWGIVAGGEKTQLIKTRVKALQGLLDSLSPEKP